MRFLTISLVVVLLAGGCSCPKDMALLNGEKVDSLYYHERRAADELMIEMWIDFAMRRLRFKCGPHDALGWNSKRFESWRLDVVLSGRELRHIVDSIRQANIESWESADVKDAASTLDKTTYYVRMRTADVPIERFVAEVEPEGFSHLTEVIRFAASHNECRFEIGERSSGKSLMLPYIK